MCYVTLALIVYFKIKILDIFKKKTTIKSEVKDELGENIK